MRASCCLFAVLLAGCMDRIPHEDPTDIAKRGACTMLENVSFSSIDAQNDCGLGPEGPNACQWQIVFSPRDASSSTYQWIYSDVAISGVVSCDESGSVRSDGATLFEGQFNDATLDLIWDDVAYAPRS